MMDDEQSRRPKGRRWHHRARPAGCGCGPLLFVLLVGAVLTLLNLAIGVGASVGVPFTSANISLAGCIGPRDRATQVLPPYLASRVGGHQDFINQSVTVTVWVAEGCSVFVVGNQPGAPAIDLHLEAH
ncbi:MAG: hypothetical protein ACYDAY_08385 [Candidatus Dormibacteria bacterium]